MLSKILVNCKDIYLTDLDGSLTMMPRLLSALEAVLPSQLLDEQLRSAAIHILATMLPFPARYGDLDIKDILPITDNSPKLKFSDLQKRISDLLFKAIEVREQWVNEAVSLLVVRTTQVLLIFFVCRWKILPKTFITYSEG